MALVSVRYIVDVADIAIEFYDKLTELGSVRYVIDGVRAAVDFYTIHLGFTDSTPVPIGITLGRARALVAVAVGLISLVVGGLARARSGRIGAGNGRAGTIVALVLGLIGMVLSVVHLGSSSTGGFGTGGGRAGAIVALALIGANLGGLALARSRRSHSTA